MLAFREIAKALIDLQIPADSPVLVHANLNNCGGIRGGEEAIISALYTMTKRVIFPAYTTSTMVTPSDGPAHNGMRYGDDQESNLTAVRFHTELPVDGSLGSLAEKFRRLPQSTRSAHPIMSFSAIDLDAALQAQTIDEPLNPIAYLSQAKGWVLLIGADQTANTTLHYIEKLAGRKQFTRWARSGDAILACPNLPGCPEGFNKANPILQPISRNVSLDGCQMSAIPMNLMIHRVKSWLVEEPQALLCDRPECEMCADIRGSHEADDE